MKTTAILCLGDELLDGRIRDENARFLLQQARHLPIQVVEVRILGDQRHQIAAALDDFGDVDWVVVSGGLGPTADDVTRQAAADFVGDELVEDREVLQELRRRFQKRGFAFTNNNRRQCLFPESASILATDVGTAAGFCLRKYETDYYFFPGVPHEFRWFSQRYLPSFDADERSFRGKRLFFFGRGESDLEMKLDDVADRAEKTQVSIGYRAAFPIIEILVKGPTQAQGEIEAKIRDAIGKWLIAEDEENLSTRVGRRLVNANATVTVAESCTAGLVGAELTNISGSSRYFERGYLTYSNQAKIDLLDTDPTMFKHHGAVSPQVVTQMAAGARRQSNATFALSISGIAGPTGGSEEKPVGTVDFGLACPEGVYYRRAYWPHRSRKQVRVLSVHLILAMLLWRLEDRIDEHSVDGPFSYPSVRRGISDTKRSSE